MRSKPRLLRALFWVVSILMTSFVVGGFLLPREMKVRRSVTIHAPRSAVYDQIESFAQWETWAPWFKRDPFLEKKFEGPASGLGAVMWWKSKKEGEGRIKIVAALTMQTLRMAVDFGDAGDAFMAFELRDAGESMTEVTWEFQTDFGQNMARRYFGLFFSRSVTADLDEGLNNLKEKLENPAASPPHKVLTPESPPDKK